MKKEINQVYKSIKIPQWVHENSKQASLILSRKGIDSLPPEVLSPQYCPNCNSKMEKLELKCSYKKCPRCGYRQQDFTASSNSFKGIGAGIGVGVSLLIYFLSKSDQDKGQHG